MNGFEGVIIRKHGTNKALTVTQQQLNEIAEGNLKINGRLNFSGHSAEYVPGQTVAFYNIDTPWVAIAELTHARQAKGMHKADLPYLTYIGMRRAKTGLIVPGSTGYTTLLARQPTIQAMLNGDRLDVRDGRGIAKDDLLLYVGITDEGIATRESALMQVVKMTPTDWHVHYASKISELPETLDAWLLGWKSVTKEF